ncbi:hypothetical protein BGX29_007387, partial [Mortierella sp. GBA35]
MAVPNTGKTHTHQVGEFTIVEHDPLVDRPIDYGDYEFPEGMSFTHLPPELQKYFDLRVS